MFLQAGITLEIEDLFEVFVWINIMAPKFLNIASNLKKMLGNAN